MDANLDLNEDEIAMLPIHEPWSRIYDHARGGIGYENHETSEVSSMHPLIEESMNNLMMQKLPKDWKVEESGLHEREVYVNVVTGQKKFEHPLLRQELAFLQKLPPSPSSFKSNLSPLRSYTTDINGKKSGSDHHDEYDDDEEDEEDDEEEEEEDEERKDSPSGGGEKDNAKQINKGKISKNEKDKLKNSKLSTILDSKTTIQEHEEVHASILNKSPIDIARWQIYSDYPLSSTFFVILTTFLCCFECYLIALPMTTSDVYNSGMNLQPWQQVTNNPNPGSATWNPVNLTGPNPQVEYYYRFSMKIASWSYWAQVYVISVSTFLFFVNMITVNYYIDTSDKVVLYNKGSKLAFLDFYLKEILEAETIWKKIKKINSLFWTHFDGVVGLEFFFLLFGWCTIFLDPALAVLRVFRIFRQMYYVEYISDDNMLLTLGMDKLSTLHIEDEDKKKKKPAKERWFNLKIACQICLHYLRNIGTEMFSAASKGGAVIVILFFFVVYVFGVLFWHQDGLIRACEIDR